MGLKFIFKLILSKNLRFSASFSVLLVPRHVRNGAKPQGVGCAGKARLAHELYFQPFLTVWA